MAEPTWWVYLGDEVRGPFSARDLADLEQLSPDTQICPDGTESWRVLENYPDLVERIQSIRSGRSTESESEEPSTESNSTPRDDAQARIDGEGQRSSPSPGQSENEPAVAAGNPPEETWYIRLGPDTSDPFTLEELKNAPSLTGQTEVRRESEDEWREAGEVPELIDTVRTSSPGKNTQTGSDPSWRTWALLGIFLLVLIVYLYVDVL